VNFTIVFGALETFVIRAMLPRTAQQLRRCHSGVGKLLLLASVCAFTGILSSDKGWRPALAQVGGGVAKGDEAAHLVQSLREATSKLAPLQSQVGSGSIVPQFGLKADAILAGVLQPDVKQAVDGALHALFIQQVALLRQQLADKFQAEGRDVGVVVEADEQFVAEAEALVRPGSEWSFAAERSALKDWLSATFMRDANIAEERARAAKLQRVTVDVISKLQ